MRRSSTAIVLLALLAFFVTGFALGTVLQPVTRDVVSRVTDSSIGITRSTVASGVADAAPQDVTTVPVTWPSSSPADSVPPVTTIAGVDDLWHNKPVQVTLTAEDDLSGVAATFFSLDDGPLTQGTSILVEAPLDHSNDGEHTILYYSVDAAGNREAPREATVRIDTKPPGFAWVGVEPSIIHRVQPVTLKFKVKEPSGSVTIAYRVFDQYGQLVARRGGLKRETGPAVVTRSINLPTRYNDGTPLLPGLYRVSLTLTDQFGYRNVTKMRVFRSYRPMQPKVTTRVPGAGKRIALTFDDGGAAAWKSILDTFKAFKAHATFFPLGPYVAASPELAKRTIAEGHAVGSHGWTHTLMTKQSADAVQSEVMRSASPWWTAANATPAPYCRPPYGGHNRATDAALGAAGFGRIILWDVDPRDWTSPGASVIAARVLNNVHPGAIVCMHLRPQTAQALPAILRGLKARGYKAVSLPELFRAAGYR